MSLAATMIEQGRAFDRPPAEWRYWLPPAALSLALAFLFLDPFAGDWDALDYTVLAIRGEASSMILGRMLYLYFNHALWLIAHHLFGLPSQDAWLLFKYSTVVQTPLAVVAMWKLSRLLTGSASAATVAAMLLALSPYFIVYSGQAMAEIPSILLMCVALILHIRGLETRTTWKVLAGAALLGAAVNVREGVALFGLWLVLGPLAYGWTPRRRELAITAAACVVFFALALGPFLLAFFFNIAGYADRWREWARGTKLEQDRHPITLDNFRYVFRWMVIGAPVVLVSLPFALWSEWRARHWSPALAFGLIGIFANLTLITHYSVVLNGRYMLTGLPGMVPLAGAFFMRWQERTLHGRGAFARALLLTAGLTAALGFYYAGQWGGHAAHASWKQYRTRLELLPPNAVAVSGAQTVSASFWSGVGAGSWGWIGTGAGWPGDEARFVEAVNAHMAAGRRVFVDFDPALWAKQGWGSEETAVIAHLDHHFRFRQLSGTWYELRPMSETDATDMPDLAALGTVRQ